MVARVEQRLGHTEVNHHQVVVNRWSPAEAPPLGGLRTRRPSANLWRLPGRPPAPRFAHGVASGDPTPDGVLLWTRVTPRAERRVPVRWRVGLGAALDDVVAEGEVEAEAARDFTVKVDVRGLQPATTYHFRFSAGDERSPVGRTRTAPGGATGNVRLGVVSCASWPLGWFNAYGHLAEQDVDLVVHLGDYLYENGGRRLGTMRVHQPRHRLRSLADYRTRHAQYKTDPDLQRLHQQHAMVAVWDDHEIAGNAWSDGAADHDPDTDGTWADRRAAAVQAYLEWMPVRAPDPNEPQRIYRTVRLGDLATLIVLDTRLAGRERPSRDGNRAVATVLVRDRSLLGDAQRAWLHDELESPVRWRLLANQVMMAPLRLVHVPRPLRPFVPGLVAGGAGVNAGQWDGYPEERRMLFDHLQRLGSTVVLTGDLHSSWAGELTLHPKDPAEDPVGVEFVAPSVTARSFAASVAPPVPGGRALLRRVIARQNPHLRWFDLERHGYVVLDVDPDRVQADWWHVDTVAHRPGEAHVAASWLVRHGETRLRPASAPVRPRTPPARAD